MSNCIHKYAFLSVTCMLTVGRCWTTLLRGTSFSPTTGKTRKHGFFSGLLACYSFLFFIHFRDFMWLCDDTLQRKKKRKKKA
jgi:hypothetical protein